MGFSFLRGEQSFYKKNNFSEFSDSPERPSGGPKTAVTRRIKFYILHSRVIRLQGNEFSSMQHVGIFKMKPLNFEDSLYG
jgi:hypothetical protein